MVMFCANKLKQMVAIKIQLLPSKIGRFAPKRSKIFPLIGASIAPTKQPGNNKQPAVNASCPDTS